MSGLRERLLGDRDHLGWWTLPMFLIVGLAGAVLAGSLAAVYFGQQVDQLEESTRDARERAAEAAAEVERAREEALAEIEEQVAGVRETLSREFPFEDVAAAGVVSIRAFVGAPPPEQPAPGGDGEGTSPRLQDDGASPGPEASPTTAPAREVTERVGSGFAVASDDGVVFFATTHALVADPDAPGGVVQRLEVTTARGTFAATVHSWDADRDLAVVRADAGESEIPLWRSADTPLARGERVVAAGLAPTGEGIQVAGQVALVDVRVLVTDLSGPDLLQGGPIVDASGHVVGVRSLRYAPFGRAAGDRQSDVPVRLLCESMLRNCEALQAPPAEDDADG